jgi:endonuclease YncB( thermonuclease family)
MKIMAHKYPNFAILFVTALFFESAGMFSLLNAEMSNFKDLSSSGIKSNPSASYLNYEKTVLFNPMDNTIVTEELNSTSKSYYVAVQSEPTIPQNENQPLTSSGTNVNSNDSQTSTGNAVTKDNGLPNNNSPATDSTDSKKLDTISTTVKCEGSALCIMGEVVKVINGKTFYVSIHNKVYKVELALIDLPVKNEQAMRAATTFTRNTCLGSTVLIDQDDRQRENAFIAQVYCSPTRNLNALLLNTGYVLLDKSQCETSEFSKLDWAKSHGC